MLYHDAKKRLKELIEETIISSHRADDFMKLYRNEMISLYNSLDNVMNSPDTLCSKISIPISAIKDRMKELETSFYEDIETIEPEQIHKIAIEYLELERQLNHKCHICEFIKM